MLTPNAQQRVAFYDQWRSLTTKFVTFQGKLFENLLSQVMETDRTLLEKKNNSRLIILLQCPSDHTPRKENEKKNQKGEE